MQNQGKQLLLAVSLALGVMLVWNMIFHPKDQPKDQQQGSGSGALVAPAPVVQTTSPVTSNPDAPPAPPLGPEQTIVLTFPNVAATFSSHDGILKSWHLTDKRYDRDFTRGELLPDPKKE